MNDGGEKQTVLLLRVTQQVRRVTQRIHDQLQNLYQFGIKSNYIKR